MSLGLALAGGGLQAVAHIGALKALQDLDVKIDYISGTSSGSLVATSFAMGYTTEEMKEIVRDYYKTLIQIQKKPLITAAGTYLLHKEIRIGGLVPGEKVENLVKMLAEKKNIKNISDITIPLAIPTVDTISTKECISISKKYDFFNEDIDYIYDIPIEKAVRASMAFPGIFTTCDFGKYNFIDGGTKDNLPIQILKDMGATKTLGINFDITRYEPSNNIMNIILRAVDIFSLKDVRKAQKIADLAIEIDTQGTSLLEITDLDKCYQIGYNTIMNHKEEIFNILISSNV